MGKEIMYHSDYFYEPKRVSNSKDTFTITNGDIEKIKSLKSSIVESAYYDNMLCWELSNNPQIKNVEELSRLFVCMQFIAMIGSIKEEVNVTIRSLLRRLYLESDDDMICMGYKRPFGNSHVMGDVRDEMKSRANIDDEDENYEEEEKMLVDFVQFLDEFYKGGFDLKWRSFKFYPTRWPGVSGQKMDPPPKKIEWVELGFNDNKHSYLRDWRIDVSEVREEIINKI